MADSPSPLALAREAEEKALGLLTLAHFEYGAGTRTDNGIEQAREYLAAQRTHREALVEATLRWQARCGARINWDGWVLVDGDNSDDDYQTTISEVLKEIEEANRV